MRHPERFVTAASCGNGPEPAEPARSPRRRRLPRQAFHFDVVDSTNEAAKRLLAEGRIRGPAYVLAREQTAGRGTRGRSWLSPRDAGLYLSAVHTGEADQWHPGVPPAACPSVHGQASCPWHPASAFSVAAGVACAEALRRTAGLEVRLKPVNDLYADGRKLGGILTEGVVENGGLKALITGVGVNLRRADRPLRADAVAAVCLEDVLPPERFERLDLAALVDEVLDGIDAWYARLAARASLPAGDQTAELRSAWQRHQLPGTALPADWAAW